MADYVEDYDEWNETHDDELDEIEEESEEDTEETIKKEFGDEGLEEVEEEYDRGDEKFLAQFYIGTNIKKWQTVWNSPTFEMEPGRATVAFRSREYARRHSDDGTVVRVSNTDVDAIMAFIEPGASDENDWTHADDYNLKDKLKIYEDYDMYLIDLYKYRKLIKTSHV